MILDASALSAFLVEAQEIQPYAAKAGSFCIPVIVLGEYRYGLRRSRLRDTLEEKLGALLSDVSVLAVEEDTAEHYADIRIELKTAGTPIPENDLWIAALVRQHRMPLLSRDTHFDCVARVRRVGW